MADRRRPATGDRGPRPENAELLGRLLAHPHRRHKRRKSEPLRERRDREAWAASAREYHQQRGERLLVVERNAEETVRLRGLLAVGVSLERACREIEAHRSKQGAASSTIEALMMGLRERGTAALAEEPVRQRLAQLDQQQVIEVGDRLQMLQSHIAKAWAPEEVRLLLEAWQEARR